MKVPSAATAVALLLAPLGPGCSRSRDLLGTYSGASFLSVDVVPVSGTTGTRGAPTACIGTIQIDRSDDGMLRGRFTRSDCLPVRAPETQGELFGSVLPDGTATLTFSTPPLATSQAVRTSCGCPDASSALGPYVGRITKSSITLRTQFRLDCCGLPQPPLGLPAFDVEYKIAAAR
jgi:hypothetical protein